VRRSFIFFSVVLCALCGEYFLAFTKETQRTPREQEKTRIKETTQSGKDSVRDFGKK
jgi:uncharacterized protein (DUF2225 family)